MTTEQNPFLIRGDRLFKFVDAVLVIDVINNPDLGCDNSSGSTFEMTDGLKVATLVNAQKKWDDPTLSGVFPLPPAIVEALYWFRVFLAVNAPQLAEMELSAASTLNWLVYPTLEDIEESVQRVTDAEPLIRFFNRFASGELTW